jgi:hypothetical protein
MTLVFTVLGTSMPTEDLPGIGASTLSRSALRAAARSVGERGDLFQLHAGGWVQLVARDRRAARDVAGEDLDAELRERLYHQPVNWPGNPPWSRWI